MNTVQISYSYGKLSYNFKALSELSQKAIDLALIEWKKKRTTCLPEQFIDYIQNLGYKLTKL